MAKKRSYARGITTRQISEQIEEIYGFDISKSFVSNVMDKMLPEITELQNRPLEDLYLQYIHFLNATP